MPTHHTPKRPKLKLLFPSFADRNQWRVWDFHIVVEDDDRMHVVRHKEDPTAWRKLREQILIRDDFSCRYCGFQAEKWQIVHHIDGNPRNDDFDNLETVCPMCNLVLHAGRGCTLLKIVDLYEKSKFSQAEIIALTRRMRALGQSDGRIISKLGLKGKMPFQTDRSYLRKLFAFISSRKPSLSDQTAAGLEYGYEECRKETPAKNS